MLVIRGCCNKKIDWIASKTRNLFLTVLEAEIKVKCGQIQCFVRTHVCSGLFYRCPHKVGGMKDFLRASSFKGTNPTCVLEAFILITSSNGLCLYMNWRGGAQILNPRQ